VNWTFTNRHTGRITLAQWPNATLGVFVIAEIVARVVPLGHGAKTVVVVLGRVAIVLWALDEVLRGVNPFRRSLGIIVLIAVGWGFLHQ